MVAGRPPANARDVRASLIEAATELLAEVLDPTDVSVAELVRRAGCTPPSLYHHFGNRDGLLRAASELQFEDMASAIRVAAQGASDPIEALVVRALAYFDHAVVAPASYRVLFMGRADGPASADDPEPGAALVELVDAVAAALPEHRRHEALGIALAMWGSMHGLSAMHVANPIIPVADIRSTLAASIRALAAGFELTS